jgi:glycosyltransferase involved in cell wall biosynthesis
MKLSDEERSNIAVMCAGFLRYGVPQAIALRANGAQVTLYYVDRRVEFAASRSDREKMLDQAEAAGVTVVRVPPRSVVALLRHTLSLHRDLRRRRIGTAIVQSHGDPRYATVGLTVRVALILHDPQPHSGDHASTKPRVGTLIARIGELTSACIIVHSARLVEQVRPLLARVPIGVVPHGASMAKGPAPVPSERRLLVFGRLFAYKGVDTALDALDGLSSEMGDVSLVVAGRGPLVDAARGRKNVEVRDEYIGEDEVDELLHRSRLVLLPYKDATQSGVGLHALGHGIPCVVSSVGGLPDLVKEVMPTLVVPPNDPRLLAGAIMEHLDHDDSMRQRLYDYAARSFSWPVVARRLCAEIERLAPIA